MFRVRRAFWSGVAILQVSDGDRWRDADVTAELLDGFCVVGKGFPTGLPNDWTGIPTKHLHGLLARIALYERRAATARRSRRKAKGLLLTEVPTLTDVVAERFVDTPPGVMP